MFPASTWRWTRTGFINPSDAELAPIESNLPGVFLAGAGIGPKDIPETVAQASGAAAKVLGLFRQALAIRQRI